jgi:hypothetical protein
LRVSKSNHQNCSSRLVLLHSHSSKPISSRGVADRGGGPPAANPDSVRKIFVAVAATILYTVIVKMILKSPQVLALERFLFDVVLKQRMSEEPTEDDLDDEEFIESSSIHNHNTLNRITF